MKSKYSGTIGKNPSEKVLEILIEENVENPHKIFRLINKIKANLKQFSFIKDESFRVYLLELYRKEIYKHVDEITQNYSIKVRTHLLCVLSIYFKDSYRKER